MLKVIALLKKKPGMTLEEFSAYWREKHGPLAKRVFPGVRRYVQNHAVKLSAGAEPPVDGVAELWFDDLESLRAASDFYQGAKGKVIRDDEEKFLDRSRMILFIAQESVMKR